MAVAGQAAGGSRGQAARAAVAGVAAAAGQAVGSGSSSQQRQGWQVRRWQLGAAGHVDSRAGSRRRGRQQGGQRGAAMVGVAAAAGWAAGGGGSRVGSTGWEQQGQQGAGVAAGGQATRENMSSLSVTASSRVPKYSASECLTKQHGHMPLKFHNQ